MTLDYVALAILIAVALRKVRISPRCEIIVL